ncbi:hypothetical protein, partial [Klebsiella pneumoniae]|uniref:hypothetical protein n=1 Tax=Klebsiella pneumoniae TaxID=573 RepID=UPI0037245EF1
SLLARWQAGTGPLVTNLLHQTVRLEDDRTRYFLQLLDGARTIAEIVADMTKTFGPTTEITRADDGEPMEPLVLSTGDGVARSLAMVGKLGLLVG